MKGRDITKLKGWDKLAAIGWTPITYRGRYRFKEIGCSLQREGVNIQGERFKIDRVTVEPAPSWYWVKTWNPVTEKNDKTPVYSISFHWPMTQPAEYLTGRQIIARLLEIHSTLPTP